MSEVVVGGSWGDMCDTVERISGNSCFSYTEALTKLGSVDSNTIVEVICVYTL